MSKIGLCTKDEAKFFGKLIAGELPVSGMWKPVLNWILPTLIDTTDDKFGDRIPEPWQSDIEKLVTMVYDALQDEVLSEEEEAKILEHCAVVMNRHIDIPWFVEDDEAVIFISGWQFAASLVRKALKSVKKED